MPEGWNGAAPDTEWWMRQVHEGVQFRKRHAREEEWAKWRKWYRGDWPRGVLPSNVYFKMLRTIVPRVYFRNPSVSITSTMPGIKSLLFAKLLERADNKLLDRMGTKGQMKRAVQLSFMFGTSVPMMGFGAQFTPTPDDLSTEAPRGRSKRHSNRVEYNSLVHPDTPWFLTAHPGDVVFPNKCATWEESRWICLTTRRTSKDLEDDSRLQNNKGLPAGGKANTPVVYDGQGRVVPDGVRIWQIRDKKTGKVFVMCPDGDTEKKVLLCEDDELQIDGGLPAYPLIFNVDDEAIWGVPDSQILTPLQNEKNEIRTRIMQHRRVSIVKGIYEDGAIEPDELDKLTDDNVKAWLKAKNINALRELPPSQIPPGLIQSEQISDQEAQELMGLGTNQFGEYAPGSADRSATEANIVHQATEIRIDERRDATADLLVDFVSDMNVVITGHWNERQVEAVIGPAGVPVWIEFEPTMLQEGHYNVKVDPDTSVPITKAIREQKAVQTYGLLFQKNPFVNQQNLTEFLVNEMYGTDADVLLNNPLLHTTADQPMPLQEAVGRFQQMRAALPSPKPVEGANSSVQPPEANLLQ